jgi:hypothetical protein
MKTLNTFLFTTILVLAFSFSAGAQAREIVLSHYILPDFTEGYVMMNGGRTQQMFLNYNSVTEEMVFKRGESILAIGKEEVKEVEYAVINDRRFDVINGKFYELLYEGDRIVYAEHRCVVIPPGNPAPYGGTSQVSSVDRYSGISDGGLYYKLQLPDGYTVKPSISYHIIRDGKSTKVYSLKQFRKAYSDKRDAFDKYIKENKVVFENPESIIVMAQALNK